MLLRPVATCKPGKPRPTTFSETLALFLHPISFISENEGTGQIKWSLGLTRKKLAGFAPASSMDWLTQTISCQIN